MATVTVGGRSRAITVRQVAGMAVVLTVALVLLLDLVMDVPIEVGPQAWIAVGLATLLFALEPLPAVTQLMDRAGGLLGAALVTLLLFGTGGIDSIFQDAFVVILVYSAVVFGLRRLLLDLAAAAVGAVLPGLVGAAGVVFYLDLGADLVVWAAVSVLAGVVADRLRTATARSGRLRAVIDGVAESVTVVDATTLRIEYANHRAATTFDMSPADMVGQYMWDLTDATTEQQVRDIVAALEVGGPAMQVEFQTADPPGVHEANIRLVAGDGGTPQLVTVARDVTGLRRARLEARERAAMVEAADTAMIGTDERGWIRSWNTAAQRLYGVTELEAIGKHSADVVAGPADDPLQARGTFDADQRYLRYSTRHTGQDGRAFDAEVTAWPVAGSDDTAPGVALLVRDVTDQRRAAEALRHREAQFRTFAEQASGVVYRFAVDPEPTLTYLSPRVTEVLGDDAADLVPDPTALMERIHPDDGHPFAAVDGEPPRLTEGVHTYRVRHTDGTWVWLEDHHRPERDDTGRIVATQGILFDVSARQEFEQARTEALEQERRLARELERTATAQQTFLRSVSHELRTPLTSVRGFAHTLRDHRAHLDGVQTEQLLDRLVANVERLDDQLADLLDLDLGLAPPRRDQWVEVDLQSLCTAAVATVDLADHDVVADAAAEVVRGDQVRLGRAVTSLVRNAVRHTPSGTTVTMWTESTPDEVTLYVADDGPGVDEEIRETMFRPFVQGQAAATSPRPGAGVGLALAREVATLHGGEVGYRAHTPQGSCFHLRLPRNR